MFRRLILALMLPVACVVAGNIGCVHHHHHDDSHHIRVRAPYADVDVDVPKHHHHDDDD